MFKCEIPLFILKILLLFILSFLVFFVPSISEGEVVVESRSALLVDIDYGRILYEKNMHESLPPASITKLMTLFIAVEEVEAGRISLEDPVRTSQYAASMGGSQVWLEPGEERTLKEMLTAVAVGSANDAAVAVAEYIAGTSDAFVNMMNERAQKLGMVNTYFDNAHGLPSQNQAVTAYDIYLLAREAVKYPLLLEFTSLDDIYFREGQRGELRLFNTNRLLNDYVGMDGLKTGHTQSAGYCLVSTAQRDGRRLIAVVLNADNPDKRFDDSRALLDYGFHNFYEKQIIEKGEILTEADLTGGSSHSIELKAKEDLTVLLKNIDDDPRKEIVLNKDIEAPVEKGEKLGKILTYDHENEIMGQVDLIAASKINRLNFIKRWLKSIVGFFT